MRAGVIGFAGAAALASLLASCAYNLPQNGPGKTEVLDRALEVVAQRYPRAVKVQGSDHVVALAPVETFGGTRARRQIKVWVRQNYTGAWEPIVQVSLNAQVGEPAMGGFDPEDEYPTMARPLVHRESWHTLQRQYAEEQEIYDEIVGRPQV
jgi:hypothetical protein